MPNYKDCPPELQKRFTLFDRPMGEGPPTGSVLDPRHLEECRKFLIGHGWEEVAEDSWRDPLAADQRGKKELVRMLKDKDKKTDKPLEQLVLPPAPIRYRLFDAVGVQRFRNANPDNRPLTPLEQVDALSKEIEAIRRRNLQIASELVQMSKRPAPVNLDAARADMAVMRRALSVAAERLKNFAQEKEAA